MRKSALFIVLFALGLVGVAGAQLMNWAIFELPKFTQPPVLDGVRGTVSGEWDGALELECSISLIIRHGTEYGWRDVELQNSEVGANRLNQSEGEDAAVARTDDDLSSFFWQAWDDDAFYYIAEVRDNVRDVVGGETATNWWERDSISLYLDLTNAKRPRTVEGLESLNIVNFVAAPQRSSSSTVTWEYLAQSARVPTQDAELIEGLEYGFRDAGDEFGGEADYAIEAMISWDALRRFDLPAKPEAGTEIGFQLLLPDPDNDDAFGGQLVCWGWANDQSNWSTWVFSDTPAGPAAGTAVEEDSWGRIKATFNP